MDNFSWDEIRPTFESLPLSRNGPDGNAWGLFGSSELGMLNLLNTKTTKAASKLIIDGTRISTDLPLGWMAQPLFGRPAFRQNIKALGEAAVFDDALEFNTQSSSQWDGFRHYGYQKERLFYNGTTENDILKSSVIGTDAWVKNGGIVGCVVLLDWLSWAESQGLSTNALETTIITVDQLQKVIAYQGVELSPGDILFVRTGYVKALGELTEADQLSYIGQQPFPPAVGLESSKTMARWLWEHGFAAVGSDTMGLEAMPPADPEIILHEYMLSGWGMPIGELFDLEELAEACKEKGRWRFFFSSVPLKVPGGVASPPNGVAIL